MTVAGAAVRLSIFPLAGALLFPRALLPLHIFEPRYRALVKDALARDRRIAMIQPREPEREGHPPALYDIGCVGRIAHVEALDDGRFNIVLEGQSRFRVAAELDRPTLFRQIEASFDDFDDDAESEPLELMIRAALEQESKRFANARGYVVDWDAVARLDDESLVNGIAQIAPFDVAAKQALLESPTIAERADLLIQFMQFFRMRDEDDDGRTTFQ
ncbi:MAG: LON peptidase substrate-binding domain-containing protein [Sphingomonas sp.]|nr:LON peptidase substrate-binding domain-containing protein [Sphingomonas sp.]MDX3885915.1 LON peptidase substrate-binding domain-containing protein [Sphingomonas sp.]